ncbi:Calcineurin-like phosphoesterase [compost metagenome]
MKTVIIGFSIIGIWFCFALSGDGKALPKDETKNRPLRIMLISDLNGAYGSVDYSPDVSAVIAEVSRIKPDLILCAGDMVAGQKASLTDENLNAMWDSFEKVILNPVQKQKIPFGFTMGNHDASPGFIKDRTMAAQFWKQHREFTGLTFVDDTHYPFYFSYLKNNVFFISWDAAGARINPEVYEWMDMQLSHPVAKKARMRIVLGHLPLYAIVAAKNKAGEVNAAPDHALQFFKQKGIDLYISGHQHAYYPAMKEGVRLLNAGCIGEGPRAVLGHHEPPKKAYTLIEIPVKRPLQFIEQSFIPQSNEPLITTKLPDSVSGFNGTIYRRDQKK